MAKAQTQEEAHFNDLRDILHAEGLESVEDTLSKDYVIMQEDGNLAYVDINSPRDQTGYKAGLRRKHLVLGMNGYRPHSLEEANRKLGCHRDNRSWASLGPFKSIFSAVAKFLTV